VAGWSGISVTSDVAPELAAISPCPIEYTSVGKGGVVLAIHGSPGGWDQAVVSVGPLIEKGFRLVAPSRPGYLGTSLDAGRTPAEQADLLARLLDVLHIPRAVLVATSGGGPIGVEFALRHPRRTSGLAMLSAVSHRYALPGSAISRRIFMSDFLGWTARSLFRLSPRVAARSLLRQMSTLRGPAFRRLVDEITSDRESIALLGNLVGTMHSLRRRRAGMNNDVEQISRLRDLPLANIGCPVLIVHGRADANVPFDHAEALQRSLPSAELLAFDGGSHLLMLEPNARSANDRLIAFLSRCLEV